MKGRDLATIDAVEKVLLQHDYVADRVLATVVFLSLKLGKPLLLEGEAGVGKTQVAKTLAEVLDAPLIRLQCYEGLDVNNTIYEWNYTRQLLHIRMLEAQSCDIDASVERDLFGEEYLIKRPLLQAIELSAGGQAPVLLIDELDRADEEFEAFLLELLSDFQITIPEIGTMRAARPPVVVITSNRTREIHDALKRRCIYHWIDYPTLEREHLVVTLKVPATPPALAWQIVTLVHGLRETELYKLPGVAETLDWAEALVALGARELNLELVERTLGFLLKYQDDFEVVRKGQRLGDLVQQVHTESLDRALRAPEVSFD
ncbi:MAG: MoxR family ATPase [Anaerolineae bacterium]|nr:MoxR family ATPase [Anaerolineae bacterium]